MVDIDDVSLQQIDVADEIDELVVSGDGEVVDEVVEFGHFKLDAFDSLFEDLVEIGFIFMHLYFLLS